MVCLSLSLSFGARAKRAVWVNISGARTAETPGPGDASVHFVLAHFGFDSEQVQVNIAWLEKLGAKLLEGPIQIPTGARHGIHEWT
jgi:hypothetical protein